MSACDKFGNPEGQKQNITDAVLDTAGEEEFNAASNEQEMAAEALVESAFGTTNGYYNGTYWTE
jgi:hypothetical protein